MTRKSLIKHYPFLVIMDDDSNFQWNILSGKLASLLHNIETPYGKRFHDFTSDLKHKCSQIFRTYERILETSSVTCNAEFVIINHQSIDFTQEFNEIKTEITDHLENSPLMLMQYFQKESESFARKLRLCYEKFFFTEVQEYIIRLYRITNGHVMVDLERRVIRLRDLPVCRLGLQMKNEWWLSMFDPISIFASFYNEKEPSCNSNCQDVCTGYFQDGNDGCEYQGTNWFNKYLKMSHPEGSDRCYKNVDLMREKLQTGAAKVLSRSWSEFPTVDEKNIVQFGANIMANEIRAKVENLSHVVPRRMVFRSFKNTALSCTKEDDTSNFDPSYRSRSVSTPNLLTLDSQKERRLVGVDTMQRRDGFNHYFGKVIQCIKNVFKSPSPLSKGQCLTKSLSKIVKIVTNLRKQKHSGDSHETYPVSAEDLLPLLVLLLLKLKPEEVAKLYVEMCFISDMLVDFLSYGCHSYALTVFQTAFRILSQVFDELDLP